MSGATRPDKTVMSRDAVERASIREGIGRAPNMRPKDASTLIILDGHGPKAKVLMGRRHERHKFMPGLFVFPGGRVDTGDGSVTSADDLHPDVHTKLISNLRGRPSDRRARGIALAALRETYEEAGLLLGERDEAYAATQADWQGFAQHGVAPTLSHLRLLARAITPPGRSRRFDAWFFVTTTDHIAVQLDDLPTQELQDLHWLNIDDALDLDLPVITVSVLNDLKKRLERDPELAPETPLPFYHMRHNRYVEETI